MAAFSRRGQRGAAALRLATAAAAALGVLAAGYRSVVVAGEAPAGASGRVAEQLAKALATCRELSEQVAPYDAVFRRNPMTPLLDGTGQLISSVGLHDGLAVQGIIWSDDHPLVVVDDELYAEGAVVGPYRIKQIRPYRILVERGGQEQFIPLGRGPTQSPASAQ